MNGLNKKIKHYIFVGMMSFSSSLFCMNGVLQVFLDDSTIFDHVNICAQACNNKEFSKEIKKTNEQRIEVLKKSHLITVDKKHVIYNKYRSACAFLQSDSVNKELTFSLLSLAYEAGQKKVTSSKFVFYPEVHGSPIQVEGYEKPRFDKKGNACLYMQQTPPTASEKYRGTIVEYSLNTGSKKALQCVSDVNMDGSGYTDLIFFSAVPWLLEAFLKSTKVQEDDIKKIYCLEGMHMTDRITQQIRLIRANRTDL